MKITRSRFLILPVFFLFFAPLILHAQTPGRLDTCSLLKFHSELEKNSFAAFCSDTKPDYLAMAVAVDAGAKAGDVEQIRGRIKEEVTALRNGMDAQRKPAKKLNFVFDHVQKTFLKQYDLDAGFYEMFGNGNFNCLTATFLYSVLLDELSVKHTIKFMPGHVYLIAYADAIPYIFETTDPENGFSELTSTAQRNAIHSLRLMKYIASDNGQNNEGNGDIFEHYYIHLNNTELKGLIGYEYTNAGYSRMMKKDYLNAYREITKALVITPLDELGLLQEELLKAAIVQTSKTSVVRATLLADYYNSVSVQDRKNQVADEFKQMTYTCLFSTFPSPDSLQPIYETLKAGIPDQDMRVALDQIYLTQTIYYQTTKKETPEMFTYLYGLYQKDKSNDFIRMALQEKMTELTDPFPLTVDGIARYDSMAAQFPDLMDFDIFRYNRCRMLVYNAQEAFRLKDPQLGEKLLARFENENYIVEGRENYCNPSKVYSLAGSYYYKKGNTAKARQAFQKGLNFDPNDWELKEKLKALN
jgi:tetratricopeptide (TPR) repeat protein